MLSFSEDSFSRKQCVCATDFTFCLSKMIAGREETEPPNLCTYIQEIILPTLNMFSVRIYAKGQTLKDTNLYWSLRKCKSQLQSFLVSRQSPRRTGNPKHVSAPPVRAAPLTSTWPWAGCAIPFLSTVFPARLSTVSNSVAPFVDS